MSQNNIQLLIGASITLITSVITIIITSIIQNSRDNRSRNWQKEDNKRNFEASILKNRINSVEDFLNKIADLAKNLYLSEYEIFKAYQFTLDQLQKLSMQERNIRNFSDYDEIFKKHNKSNLISTNQQNQIDLEKDEIFEKPEFKNFIRDIREETRKKLLIEPDNTYKYTSDFLYQINSIQILNDYDPEITNSIVNSCVKYIKCLEEENEEYRYTYNNFFLYESGFESYSSLGNRLEKFDSERSGINGDIRYLLDKLLINNMSKS